MQGFAAFILELFNRKTGQFQEKKMRKIGICLIAFSIFGASRLVSGDWSIWRGPDRDGIAKGEKYNI